MLRWPSPAADPSRKEVILTGDSYSVEEMAPFGLLFPPSGSSVRPDGWWTVLPDLEEPLLRRGHHARVDLSVDVFAEVFASPETRAQIDRHRAAIGRRRGATGAGPAGV